MEPGRILANTYETLPSGTAYLVMERLEGESLAARLRRGKLSVASAVTILRQIGAALNAAHGAGVIHRDLENVYLSPRGNLCGLSCSRQRQTRRG